MSDEPEEQNPVIEAIRDEIEVVPYTKRDRKVMYLIAVIVVANLVMIAAQLPWGALIG